MAVSSAVQAGQLVADGKAFFVNGIYTQQVVNTDLQRIASLGFNTVLSYAYETVGDDASLKAYLDGCQSHNLYALVSIKDLYPENNSTDARWRDIVTKFKSHPALLGWYLNDEFGPDQIPEVAARYQAVKQLDPNHITNSVLYENTVIGLYNDTSDVIGTDPYDWRNASTTTSIHYSLNSITDVVNAYHSMSHRSTLCVTQMHNRGLYPHNEGNTEPPYAVKLAMALIQPVLGCQGQLQYSYFDQLRMLKDGQDVPADPATLTRRFAEMSNITQLINSNSPYFLGTNNRASLLEASNPDYVTWGVWAASPSTERLYLVNGNNTQATVALLYQDKSHHTFQLQPWEYMQVDL
jgi:hypothetical protein